MLHAGSTSRPNTRPTPRSSTRDHHDRRSSIGRSTGPTTKDKPRQSFCFAFAKTGSCPKKDR
eukprot:1057407-Pyramimonas_sp.AAC.1